MFESGELKKARSELIQFIDGYTWMVIEDKEDPEVIQGCLLEGLRPAAERYRQLGGDVGQLVQMSRKRVVSNFTVWEAEYCWKTNKLLYASIPREADQVIRAISAAAGVSPDLASGGGFDWARARSGTNDLGELLLGIGKLWLFTLAVLFFTEAVSHPNGSAEVVPDGSYLAVTGAFALVAIGLPVIDNIYAGFTGQPARDGWILWALLGTVVGIAGIAWLYSQAIPSGAGKWWLLAAGCLIFYGARVSVAVARR